MTLRLDMVEEPAETRTLLFDLPGQSDECVVLSAHVDGHDIDELVRSARPDTSRQRAEPLRK